MTTMVDTGNTARPLSGAEACNLSLGLSLGFGVGTVGISILLNTVAVYFPALMLTVLGLSPAIAGYLLTGSKLYDVGADLVIGLASDRTRSRWGPRRPYLLAGALVGATGFIMLFNPLKAGGVELIGFAALALIICSTGYSLFNVPYLAMPSEMTQGYHQRTTLMSYRTVFIAVGQLLALSGGAALIGLFGGDRGGYAKMGLILGAAAAASMLISFFGTARARQGAPPLKSGRTSPLEAARLVFQNRPFVLLMACKFCNLLALSATTSTQLLFLLNVTRAGYSGQLQLTLGLNIAMAASLPAWTVASRKLGKRNGYIIATVLYIVATLSWLLSRQGEPASALVARGVLTGLSSGGMLLFGGAMLPDTMEHDRRQTGLRRAGMFSSLYAIVEKFAFALGPGLIGLYLAAQHYIPTKHGRLVVQPPSAIEALYMGIAVIPAILSIVGIALLAFYKLDESTLGPEL